MDTHLRAARAKALLEDPLLKEAFDVVQNAQIAVFTSPLCSDAEVMEANRMVRALRLLKDHLTSVVTDGKMLERREGKKR